ncbi:MAG: hypothetical protein AABY22_15650 [Nanoarchaeota archaeon]
MEKIFYGWVETKDALPILDNDETYQCKVRPDDDEDDDEEPVILWLKYKSIANEFEDMRFYFREDPLKWMEWEVLEILIPISEPLMKGSEVIELMEWQNDNFYIRSANDLWYKQSDGNPESGITTKQLIELFKNRNNG